MFQEIILLKSDTRTHLNLAKIKDGLERGISLCLNTYVALDKLEEPEFSTVLEKRTLTLKAYVSPAAVVILSLFVEARHNAFHHSSSILHNGRFQSALHPKAACGGARSL